MKRHLLFCSGLLFLLLLAVSAPAQSSRQGFRSLSRPEKWWVAAHPFAAKRAWRCTRQARLVTDSLGKAGVLSDGNGGQLDAFRHAYWMALLVQKMPARKAAKLGRAHEKGNYLDYLARRNEDGTRPDSLMCEMDLRNNAAGIAAGKAFRADTAKGKSLTENIIHLAWDGGLTIVKKDANGVPLTCEGRPIDLTMYDGKWFIPKCLVRSDEITVKH
jgi:hypothetical protein